MRVDTEMGPVPRRELGSNRVVLGLGAAAIAAAILIVMERYALAGGTLLAASWFFESKARGSPGGHVAVALAVLLALGPGLLLRAPAWAAGLLLIGCLFEAVQGLSGRPDQARMWRQLGLSVGVLGAPLTELWGWSVGDGLSCAIALWACACAASAVHALGLRANRRSPAPTALLGRGGAVRSAFAGVGATALDFAAFHGLLLLALSAPLATLAGCAVGAVANFALNRAYAFRSTGSLVSMAVRYGAVSGVSALFNAGLVAVLLWAPSMTARVAWIVARTLVFLVWNYPLHRDVVFQHQS